MTNTVLFCISRGGGLRESGKIEGGPKIVALCPLSSGEKSEDGE